MISATLPVTFANLPQPVPAASSDLPFDVLLTVSPQMRPATAVDMFEAEAISPTATDQDGPVAIDDALLSFIGLNPAKPAATVAPVLTAAKTPLAVADTVGDGTVAPADKANATSAALTLVGTASPEPVRLPTQTLPDDATGDAITSRDEQPDTEAVNAETVETAANMLTAGQADILVIPALATASPAVPGSATTLGKREERAASVAKPASASRESPALASIRAAPAVDGLRAEAEASSVFESRLTATVSEAGFGAVSTAGSAAPSPLTGVQGQAMATSGGDLVASAAQTPAAKADPVTALVERQLDLARDTRWIDELARDIVAASGRSDRLSFTLVPPQLGQLNVDLSQSDQGLAVRMTSEAEATTQIISAAQPRLVEDLKSQGIRVVSTEVSTGSGQQGSAGQHQQPRDDSRLFTSNWQRFDVAEDDDAKRRDGRFA